MRASFLPEIYLSIYPSIYLSSARPPRPLSEPAHSIALGTMAQRVLPTDAEGPNNEGRTDAAAPTWSFKQRRSGAMAQRRAAALDGSQWAAAGNTTCKQLIKEAPGFFPVPRLVAYEPAKLRSIAAVVTSRDLTLFASTDTIKMHLAWLAYATGLAILLAYVDPDLTRARPAYGLFAGAMNDFRTLSAFVIAGFVIMVVSAWRERRRNYSQLISATKTLLLRICSDLPITTPPGAGASIEDIAEARRLLGRWVLLALELTVAEARGLGDTEATRSYLEAEAALLMPGEWDALAAGQRSTSVFFWLSVKLKILVEKELITPVDFALLVSSTTAMRQAAHDLMQKLVLDLPYSYASIMGFLVHAVVFIQATLSALSCVVLYPVARSASVTLQKTAAALSNATTAEPEPELEPELVPEPEPELEPDSQSGRRRLSGILDDVLWAGRLLQEKGPDEATAEPEPLAGGGSGVGVHIPGASWAEQAPMWIMQLLCMLLWM